MIIRYRLSFTLFERIRFLTILISVIGLEVFLYGPFLFELFVYVMFEKNLIVYIYIYMEFLAFEVLNFQIT